MPTMRMMRAMWRLLNETLLNQILTLNAYNKRPAASGSRNSIFHNVHIEPNAFGCIGSHRSLSERKTPSMTMEHSTISTMYICRRERWWVQAFLYFDKSYDQATVATFHVIDQSNLHYHSMKDPKTVSYSVCFRHGSQAQYRLSPWSFSPSPSRSQNQGH